VSLGRAHQGCAQPGDAFALGGTAIGGGCLGAGAEARNAGVHEADHQAKQDAGEYDIDETHGFLLVLELSGGAAASFLGPLSPKSAVSAVSAGTSRSGREFLPAAARQTADGAK
jgi:hypothetical protein